jgi:F0F1-type ATP synthase assembly protein I
LRSAGRLSAIGWEFAISVIGCLLLGWWADKKLGTAPILALVGVGLGTATGFWILFKAVRELNQEAEKQDQRPSDEDRE